MEAFQVSPPPCCGLLAETTNSPALEFDLVMKLTPKHPFLCSMNNMDSKNPNVYYDNGIFYEGKRILENKDLPFTSHHFIQNILSAVAACISLNMDIKDVKVFKVDGIHIKENISYCLRNGEPVCI